MGGNHPHGGHNHNLHHPYEDHGSESGGVVVLGG